MLKIENPYDGVSPDHLALRGNLHAHTTQSDGHLSPQQLVDTYRNAGYDFLAISDHDVFSGAALFNTLEVGNMLLIPANEISKDGPHLLHIGADCRIEPYADRQKVFDLVSPGGFAIVNHPNWLEHHDHCPQAKMREWTGYAGIEIFNGVIGRHAGSPYATDDWDMLLGNGRHVWGYANDDLHWAHEEALGWNVVYVTERTVGAVIAALRNGRFYASTGVGIDSVTVEDSTVTVRSKNAERIVAITDFGRRIAVHDGQELSVSAEKAMSVLRFELWGRGEQFAWTQPMFITH